MNQTRKAMKWIWGNIKELTAVVALFSIPIATWSFRDAHDWNRREYAASMIAEWNEKTGDHRLAIEEFKPGLIDVDTTGSVVEIGKKDARAIYTSKPGDEHWELRFHLIELINYMEFVSMSYFHRTADQEMIEESYGQISVRIHDALKNFIEVVAKERDYVPWQPYLDFVERMRARKPREPRSKTG